MTRKSRVGPGPSVRWGAVALLAPGHEGAELGAALDSELAVGAAEVGLDRLRGHHQGRGDLLVRESLRHQLRHPRLRRGELVPAGGGAEADGVDLGTRPVGPARAAGGLEDVEGLVEDLLRGPALAQAAPDLP